MGKEYATLYAAASTGRIKVWQIEAQGNTMIIRNGLQGGAMKEQRKTIQGKNIGKKNETSPEQQCELECQSKWQSKIDEQYVDDPSKIKEFSSQDIILPMLAHPFEKRKHDIKYPCFVQPKLNGVRCIYQNGKFISREGKEFTTFEHMRPDLEKLGINLPDGEIYRHGMTFQQIIRLVKKDREDGSNSQLQYWIYDKVDNEYFITRYQDINNAFKSADDMGTVHRVPTYTAANEEEVKKYHDRFVSEGYEGVIIRNTDGKYEGGLHRSKNLQKFKNFKDDEFKIIGGKAASGSEEGAIVFQVETKDGKPFWVRPRGSMDQRREWMKDIDKLIGKPLTVRYLELSEDGIPTGNTVGIAIRDYE